MGKFVYYFSIFFMLMSFSLSILAKTAYAQENFFEESAVPLSINDDLSAGEVYPFDFSGSIYDSGTYISEAIDVPSENIGTPVINGIDRFSDPAGEYSLYPSPGADTSLRRVMLEEVSETPIQGGINGPGSVEIIKSEQIRDDFKNIVPDDPSNLVVVNMPRDQFSLIERRLRQPLVMDTPEERKKIANSYYGGLLEDLSIFVDYYNNYLTEQNKANSNVLPLTGYEKNILHSLVQEGLISKGESGYVANEPKTHVIIVPESDGIVDGGVSFSHELNHRLFKNNQWFRERNIELFNSLAANTQQGIIEFLSYIGYSDKDRVGMIEEVSSYLFAKDEGFIDLLAGYLDRRSEAGNANKFFALKDQILREKNDGGFVASENIQALNSIGDTIRSFHYDLGDYAILGPNSDIIRIDQNGKSRNYQDQSAPNQKN